MSANKLPERIWLIPNAGNDGETVWCDDPAPGADMDPDDAAEYLRRDLCASGQVRALDRAVGEDRKAGWTLPVGDLSEIKQHVYREDGEVVSLEAVEIIALEVERRILSSLTASPGWQPIETAPRDGAVFLALEDGEYYGCARSECGDFWVGYCGQPVVYTLEPTHWMPLPAAPEAEGGEDDR